MYKLYITTAPDLSFPADDVLRIHEIPLAHFPKSLHSTHTRIYVLCIDGSVIEIYGHPGGRDTAYPQDDYRHDFVVRQLSLPGKVDNLACGTQHVLFAVRLAGSSSSALKIYAMGDNSEGQCGLPVSLGGLPSPTPVPGLSRLSIKQLFCGSAFSAATLTNGSLAIWGGLNGAVGAKPNYLVVPSASFPAAAEGVQAVQIAIGDMHFVVLGSDARVYTFCAPHEYVLNADTVETYAHAARDTAWMHLEVRAMADGPMWSTAITQVAASDSTAYALAADGSLFSWGRVNKHWVESAGWAFPGDTLDPAGMQQMPSRWFDEADSPIAVCMHQTWRSIQLSLTGLRDGGDIWSNGSKILQEMEDQARLGFDQPWRDRFLCTIADTPVPWVLCQAVGITTEGRMAPCDGYLQLHRVSPNREMGTVGRHDLPFLHDHLLEYWVSSAVQTKGHLAFVGTRDPIMADPAILEAAYAECGTLRLDAEREKLFRPAVVEDTDILFQEYALPPAWAVTMRTSTLDTVLANRHEQILDSHYRSALRTWLCPGSSTPAYVQHLQRQIAAETLKPMVPSAVLKWSQNVIDKLNAPVDFSRPSSVVEPVAVPAEPRCTLRDVSVVLHTAVIFSMKNEARQHSCGATHSTAHDGDGEESVPATACDSANDANGGLLSRHKRKGRLAPPTLVCREKKPEEEVIPRKRETFILDDDDGGGFVFTKAEDVVELPLDVAEEAKRRMAGPPESRLMVQLGDSGFGFACSLNWWEQDMQLGALCSFAYGADWKGVVAVSLTSYFHERFSTLLSSTTGVVNQAKRARCKKAAIHDTWDFAVHLTDARRQRFATVVRGVLPTFRLHIVDQPYCAIHEELFALRLPTVFGAMIASEMREAVDRAWRVAECLSGSALFAFLKYVYLGELTADNDNAQALLEAADMYMIDDLKEAIEQFMISNCVVNGNAADVATFAGVHNCARLVDYCDYFAITKQSKEPLNVLADAVVAVKPVPLPVSRPVDGKRSWAALLRRGEAECADR